jgi:pimeloyl-ACP methyl ester carboxylesterase
MRTASIRDGLVVQGRPAGCRQAGSGRPVVLLHGAGGSSELWGPQLASLADAARLLAVDLPGHGGSAGPGLLGIPAYADWVVAFLDVAGVDRAVVVGHSMGGAIAQTLALERPERVEAMVLVATGARLRVAHRLLDAFRETPPEGRSLLQGLSYGSGTPAARVAVAERVLAETPPLVTVGDFLACDRFDLVDRLPRIAVPTLILAGAEDHLTPPRLARTLADGIPGARLVEIPGAGHFPQLETPEAVSGAIRTFLSSLA